MGPFRPPRVKKPGRARGEAAIPFRRKVAHSLLDRISREIFENSGTAIAVLAEDCTILLSNGEFCRLSGYEAREVDGQLKWTERVIPEDLQRMQTYHRRRRLPANDAPRRYEFRFRTKTGDLRTVFSSANLIPGTRLSIASMIDITEYRRAEDSLRTTENNYRTLVENAAEGLCVAQDGRLKFVNRAMLALADYSAEEICSRPFLEMIHAEDRPMVAERHLRRLRGEDLDHVYPFRMLRGTGDPVWVEIKAVRIEWEGRPATLNFITDITERRQAEDALIDARDRAEALLAVVNDILDFSRIQAGMLRLERVPLDVRACVEEAAGLMANTAASKGLVLRTVLAEDLPPLIAGDPVRIRQILLNLIGNAVKYTDRGEIVVTASTRTRAEAEALAEERVTPEARQPDPSPQLPPAAGGVLLCLGVEDTGIGIAADQIGRLFRSFSQVDSSATRKHGGTGLGLAICRRLVELMGGRIGVESALGRGSRFYFELPLVPAEASGTPGGAPDRAPGEESDRPGLDRAA